MKFVHVAMPLAILVMFILSLLIIQQEGYDFNKKIESLKYYGNNSVDFDLTLGGSLWNYFDNVTTARNITLRTQISSIVPNSKDVIAIPNASNTHTKVKGVEKLSVEAERDGNLIEKVRREKEENMAKLMLLLQTPKNVPVVQNRTNCPYGYKVYVYPLKEDLSVIKISEEARRNHSLHVCRKCIFEQFSLEYVFYDYFTKFCGRTEDPSKADFFYLPLVRDAEYRHALTTGVKNARKPSRAEDAILKIMENGNSGPWKQYFQVTDEYWFRRNGADHIFVMPAPVTNFRHETGRRGFFHYMPHLYPPIFVGLEYSRSFIEEYPVCNKMKNIVVPYPTVDPDLFSGKYMRKYENKLQKSALMYYAGGLHGECYQVRKAMRDMMINASKLIKTGSKYGEIVPKGIKSDIFQREIGFYSAKFCPIPVGDSPSSKRMYDVLNFGCIPVVISDDLVWAFSKDVGGVLDPSTFSLQLPQCLTHVSLEKTLSRYTKKTLPTKLPSGIYVYDMLRQIHYENMKDPKRVYQNGIYVNPLIQFLSSIPQQDIETLQKGVQSVAKYYRYYQIDEHAPYANVIATALHTLPNGNAIDMFNVQLQNIKDKGIDDIYQKCAIEKQSKHSYIGSYPCAKE